MPRRRTSYYSSYYPPSKPIETEEGLKARSQRGTFAKNWWATRWIDSLERLVDTGRLSRGRSYARKGQVLTIDETQKGIEARVQGSRSTPYKVTIQLEKLTDKQWKAIYDTLAEQAIFAAQLLAGEMPRDIEAAFTAAGTSLFPAHSKDLLTHCSCPDWANPCKHVAAAHYILGERFDEDPFLLFRLRGRDQEEILAALRQRRAGESEDLEEDEDEALEPDPPLEESLAHFWEAGPSLDQFSVSIQPPAVEMPVLKQLGEPAFIGEPGLQALLQPVYQAVQQAALETAFADAAANGEDQPSKKRKN
jgi:uncharacterized Zn finger protein